MTVNAQSRPQAFDISQYFAPEIITPTKSKKVVLVFSSASSKEMDCYDLSKHLDNPVASFFPKPRLSEELPRGISWHNFPVVSDPFYRITLAFSDYSSRDLKIDGEPMSPADMLSRADVMVFADRLDERDGAIRAYEMAYVLEKFGQGERNVLLDGGDGNFTPMPVPHFRKAMRAELRFRYSYLVNFTAIAMKAFRAVGADGPTRPGNYSGFEGVRLGDFNGIHYSSLSEVAYQPLALQWLYRLRALGSFDVSYATEFDEFTASLTRTAGPFHQVRAYDLQWYSYPRMLDEVALLKHEHGNHSLVIEQGRGDDIRLVELRNYLRSKGITFDVIEASSRVFQQLQNCPVGDSGRFFSLDHTAPTVWSGTGKHSPLEIPSDLPRVPLAFIEKKLVGYDKQAKTISLTDKGHRFLDMLHPDCEDPDVILRWTDDDGLFRDGVEQSCDDWIMRFFSKMKTKINEIEA